MASDWAGLLPAPAVRTEIACASSAAALRYGMFSILAGVYDMVMVGGFEKMTKRTTAEVTEYLGMASDFSFEQWNGITFPGLFALMAKAHMHRYGTTEEQMALIAVKNHHNGSLNPKAHFQNELTLEQVINAPVVAWPLGLFDCCGVSDGASAAVVTRADMARKFREDPIYIKGLQICVGARQGAMRQDYDFVHIEENVLGAKRVYAEAGVRNPRKEISIAEVHDCFTIHEMIVYEDLGFSPRGRAKEDIEAGTFTLEGELPVNTDGGLKCFGHPLGASGLRMMYEVYKQLQGKAGPRQIKNPRLGLTHNLGGNAGTGIASCFVVGNEKA